MNKKEFIKKHWQVTWGFEHFDSDLNAVIESACKEQSCTECNNNKLCEMWRLWKDNEHLYFAKDIDNFSCRHFEAIKGAEE
jgi:hypothetical protein